MRRGLAVLAAADVERRIAA
jgi:hypothetical protein